MADTKPQSSFSVPLPVKVEVMDEENVIQKDFSGYLRRIIIWTVMTPLFFLAYMHYSQQVMVTEAEDARQVEISNQIANELSAQFAIVRSSMERTAASLESESSNLTAAAINKTLEEFLQQGSYVASISLVDQDNNIIASKGAPLPADFASEDFSEERDVRFLGTSSDRKVCFDKKLNTENVLKNDSLAACYSTEIFSDKFARATGMLNLNVQLADMSGNDIYRSAVNEDASEIPVLTAASFIKKLKNYLGSDRPIFRTDDTRNKAQVISFAQIKDTDWLVVVSQPVALRDKQLMASLQTSGALLIIGFLITFITGSVLGRRLNSAVDRLVEQVKLFRDKGEVRKVKAEDLSSAPLELQMLSRELTSMAETVNQSREKLQLANENLTEQVFQRTKSLNHRNEELQALQKLLAPLRESESSSMVKATLDKFKEILGLTYLVYEERKQAQDNEIQVDVISQGQDFGSIFALKDEIKTDNAKQSLIRLANSIAIILDNQELYQNIKSSEARFSVLFESMTEGIILIGKSGSLLYGNGVAKRLLSVRPDEYVPSVANLISQKFRKFSLDMEEAPSRPDDLTGRWVNKTNSSFFIEITEFNVPAFPGYIGKRTGLIIRDVSEAINLDRMKRNLVSIVAHELKTPVTTMRLQSESLARVLDSKNELADEIIQDMQDESVRLQNLISDWLDVSRIEAGTLTLKPDLQSVESILKEAMILVERHYPELIVVPEIAADAKCIFADRDRIIQVFINILENAARYRSTLPPKCIVRTRKNDEGIEISFEDNGMGIAEENLSVIFNLFFQVETDSSKHTEGTGLGLAICRGIVTAHGGRIWAERNENGGTTFIISLVWPSDN